LFFLLMLNMWVFTLYGSVGDEQSLTALNIILVALGWFEQVARIWGTGSPMIYWNYANYYPKGIEIQWSNRVELMVNVISFVGFIVSSSAKASNLVLFFLALPVVRLLTFNQTVRHSMWCLILIVPMFINLLILLLLLILWFGQIGVLLFHDQFKLLEYENDGSAPQGTFDNLVKACLCLIQVLGAGGSDIMYAAVDVNGWSVVWYFLLFQIVMKLLLLNLFIGVILSMFGLAQPMEAPTLKDVEKKRLDKELFKVED